MSKTGLEFILFGLLIVSLILLGIIISDPGEYLKLIEKIDYYNFNIDRGDTYSGIPISSDRTLWMEKDNMVLMYKHVISLLTFFSCTCLICLSYLVSKK